MSRSKRKEPVSGITSAASEKTWKQHSNRKLRRASTQALEKLPEVDPDAAVLPLMREVADIWSSAKEGKGRFVAEEQPKRMRK